MKASYFAAPLNLKMRLKAQPPLKSQNVNRNEECFLSKWSIYKETKVQQVWMTCLKPYWNKSGRAGTWLPVIWFPNWETHAGQWGSQNVICKLETTTCSVPKGEAPGRILGTCHLSGHSPCQAHWGDKITFCTSVGWTYDQEKKSNHLSQHDHRPVNTSWAAQLGLGSCLVRTISLQPSRQDYKTVGLRVIVGMCKITVT